MGDITAANAVYWLGIINLFPIPQRLEGFATDDVFDTDALEMAENQMGVDGTLSSGFVFREVRQGITLQADSGSNAVFDAWFAAEQVSKSKLAANAIIMLPSIGTKWALTKGFLTNFQPLPNAGKVLRPRKFIIVWERVSPALT